MYRTEAASQHQKRDAYVTDLPQRSDHRSIRALEADMSAFEAVGCDTFCRRPDAAHKNLEAMGSRKPNQPSRVTYGSGFSPLVAAVSLLADWMNRTTARLRRRK